jgi:hypothetical protein
MISTMLAADVKRALTGIRPKNLVNPTVWKKSRALKGQILNA